MTEKIIRNSAKCALCGDEIESTYRHDYVACKCGEIYVDGGHAYLRAGAKNLDNFISTAVIENGNL
jgi:tRNA(Ile2) C34 agmatinyltransferase TiaS